MVLPSLISSSDLGRSPSVLPGFFSQGSGCATTTTNQPQIILHYIYFKIECKLELNLILKLYS